MSTFTVLEAIPTLNERSADGRLIIQQPEKKLISHSSGQIYMCCGRAFLSSVSLEKHSLTECLKLEINVNKRPGEYENLSLPKYFTNLMMLRGLKSRNIKVKQSWNPNRSGLRSSIAPNEIPVVLNTVVNNSQTVLPEMPRLSPVSPVRQFPQNSSPTNSECENKQPVAMPPTIEALPVIDKGRSKSGQLKKFKCTYCNYSSKFDTNLKNHYNKEHPGCKELRKPTPKMFEKKPVESTLIERQTPKKVLKKSPEGTLNDRKNRVCKLCKRKYKSLVSHMETNHVKNGYPCGFCKSAYATKQGLKIHLNHAHSTKYTSSEPMLQLAKNSGAEIDSNRNGNSNEKVCNTPVKCKICDVSLYNKYALLKHTATNHVHNSSFGCVFCPCSFHGSMALKIHLGIRHKASIVKASPTARKKRPAPSSNGFKCDKCVYKSPSAADLDKHKTISHIPGGVPCPTCGCTFSSVQGMHSHSARRHHMYLGPSQKRKMYSAESSSIKFPEKKTRTSLAQLQKTEENETTSVDNNEGSKVVFAGCPYCRVPILDEETLNLHLKMAHPEKKFQCEQCQMMFLSSHAVEIHIRTIHNKLPLTKTILTDTKSCQLCSQKVGGKTQLQLHLKACHSPSNNHKCTECICRFDTETGLRTHQRFVHKHNISSETENTTTVCKICQRDFNTTKMIRAHLKTSHRPNGKYKCKFCPCQYLEKTSLNAHTRMLHKEKHLQYICKTCNIQFKYSQLLKDHKKHSHNPSARFFCTLCPCRFETNTQLKMHQTKVHNVINYEIFQCDLCSVELYSPTDISNHKKAAHVENGIPCLLCSCKFASQVFLDFHVKKDHPQSVKVETPSGVRTCRINSPNYAVDLNGKSEFELEEEEKKRNERRMTYEQKCKHCSVNFPTKSILKRHINLCHDASNKVKCSQCTCTFATEMGVKIHALKMHPVTDKCKNEIIKVNEEKTTLLKSTDEKLFPCNEFKTKKELKTHTGIPNSFDDDSSADSDVVEIRTVVNSPRKRDPLSNKTTSTDSKDKTSSPNTPSVTISCRCKKCSLLFRDSEELLNHLKKVHGTNSLFKCSICASTFVNPALLMQHLPKHISEDKVVPNVEDEKKSVKSPEKKSTQSSSEVGFPCQKCNLVFDSVVRLASHSLAQHQSRV